MTNTEVILWVTGIGLLIAAIPAWCMIAKRLGYDAIFGLAMIVPVVNLAVFFYWAFHESPNERELRHERELRQLKFK